MDRIEPLKINHRFLIPAAVFCGLLMTACNNSTEPEMPAAMLFQSQGCLPQSTTKAAASNGFSYWFDDILLVEFRAEGNCCPNTNRFTFSPEIRRDTIFVTIADTAANLCRCTCTYMLHAGFRDLEFDSYVFICMRDDNSLLYAERVQRN